MKDLIDMYKHGLELAILDAFKYFLYLFIFNMCVCVCVFMCAFCTVSIIIIIIIGNYFYDPVVTFNILLLVCTVDGIFYFLFQ